MDDPLIGKFCSNGAPHPAMLSSSNVVLVQFVTDFNVNPRGFNLTYQQRDGGFCEENECCQLHLLASSVSFVSCVSLQC